MIDITQEIYYQDWKTALISRIENNQSWADLFDGISYVFAKNIYCCIEQLRFIRDPVKQDRQVNIKSAKFLNFDYNSDLFTDDEYVNLVTFLNNYNKRTKGVYDFINFLGWVKNAKFKLVQLWADGKINYSDDPTNIDPFVEESSYVIENSILNNPEGKYYPTSHVDITYDGSEFDVDESDIYYLFYKCAPIQLVLRSISATFKADPAFIYLKSAISDYSNSHICIPCIYKYYAQLYIMANILVKSKDYSDRLLYSFNTSGGNITQNVVDFNKDTPYNRIIETGIKFTRSSVASNIDKNDYYIKEVPIDYLRIEYEPESSNSHFISKGILIEPERTNLLLDSMNPTNRTITLNKGTYSFSGKGTYLLKNASNDEVLLNITDSSGVIILNETTTVNVIVQNKPEGAYYQLESGDKSSSIIKTVSNIATRSPDILTFSNLYSPLANNPSTYIIQFSKDISKNCILLYIYQSIGNFIRMLRNNNNLLVNVYKNNLLIFNMIINDFFDDNSQSEYYDKIKISLSKKNLKVNNNEFTYENNDGIIAKQVSIGQENGLQSINGHLISFTYYPIYV